MYNKDERSTTGRGGHVSVLASDLVVTGVVASEGTIELHGHVDGELAAATLIIGNEGRMKGKVQAGQVDLRGEMEGAIACGALTLRAAARLNADVQSARLVIESGAEVEGRFSRPPAATPESPAAAPAPAAEAPVAEPAAAEQTDQS
jgi:cytoskeletal protein CcmA (bactofilin family)